MLFIMSVFVSAECELAGTKDYQKIPGVDVTFSGIYSPITNGSTNYNVTEIKFYYPNLDTLITHFNNTNSDLSADVDFETDEFSLQSGTTYLYLNVTNVNESDSTDVQYECQKIEITTPDQITTLIPMVLIIFVSIAVIISFLITLGYYFKKQKTNLLDYVILIIGTIIVLTFVYGAIQIFMT